MPGEPVVSGRRAVVDEKNVGTRPRSRQSRSGAELGSYLVGCVKHTIPPRTRVPSGKLLRKGSHKEDRRNRREIRIVQIYKISIYFKNPVPPVLLVRPF